MGYINDEQLAQALAEQLGMQDGLPRRDADPGERAGLGHRADGAALSYRADLLENNTLTIAMCDPQKLSIQDELRTFLGFDVRAVVATERDIQKALDKYYAAGAESVESLVQDMEEDMDLKKAAEAMDNADGPIDLTSVEALADSAPVRKLLNMVLLMAIKDHASDLHFEPFEDEFRIRIKADGVLYEMVPPPRHLAVRHHHPHQGHGQSRHRRAPPAARRPDRADRRRASGRSARQRAARPCSAKASSCGCSIARSSRST